MNLASLINILSLTLILYLTKFIVTCEEAVSNGKYTIEGKILTPASFGPEYYTSTRILINAGEYVGFVKNDGSFVVNSIPPGTYVVDVVNPNYLYDPIRVDVTSRGKLRARKVNYIQSSHVHQLPYPLRFKARSAFKYFQVRETWKITDFLFNPMVIMMVLPFLCFMFLPKMINPADPETQREMQQMQMPKYDMPELSEWMTSLFTGSKKPSTKAVKPAKKRQ